MGVRILVVVLAVTLTVACATADRHRAPTEIAYQDPSGGEPGGVECLLPAQVRKLGSSLVYLAPRRTVRTSPGECELRGGTLTAATTARPTPPAR